MNNIYIQPGANKHHANLKNYVLSVYRYMSLALLITSAVSLNTAALQKLMYVLHYTNYKWFIACVPLAMAFYMSNRLMSLSYTTAKICFFSFAGLMGLSVSSIFIIFTTESIARVLLITAATFAAMSFYGSGTKRDLSSSGAFLVMGAISLLVTSMINLLFKSSIIYFTSSIATVMIFVAFTAYDIQRIKLLYYYNLNNSVVLSKLAIYGALTLYMDFINLFIGMLQLLGIRRSD